jgi:hypothetical protein
MWRIVLSILLTLAFVGTAAACPWQPPQPPPPPPVERPPVPPETPPNDPPPADLPPTNDPIITPGQPPQDPPTSIAAPEPRTYSDGPSGAQKVILNGAGVYEFYGRDNVRCDTHVPSVAVDHAVHERNEYRDVVLTAGQPVEYLLPTGLTYLFRWTEQGGHEYIRTFYIGAPGQDMVLNLEP